MVSTLYATTRKHVGRPATARALALAIVLGLIAAPSVRGDTFILKDGRQIEGELLNAEQTPRMTFVVRTGAGIQLTLKADQVARVETKSLAERKYEEYVKLMRRDSPEDHWKMAEWCRKSGLDELRTFHMEQVLKYDPNHADARRGLGYSRLDGKWVKPEEYSVTCIMSITSAGERGSPRKRSS